MTVVTPRAGGRERLFYGALGTLTVCGALALVAAVTTRGPPRQDAVAVPNWEQVRGGAPLHGPERADHELVIFSDFECPSCKHMDAWIAEYARTTSGTLRVSIRHYPLRKIHPHAEAAARAAVCAGQQGRYAAYHHELFRLQDALRNAPIGATYAVMPSLDVMAMRACVDRSGTAALVRRDHAIGRAAGVRGTPTLVLDGMRLPAVGSYGQLREMMRVRLGT